MTGYPIPRRSDRLNVLLLVPDQLRWDFVDRPHSPTPQLNALSRNGTTFSRCYSNAPVCVPARIGLAVARSPWLVGARDNDAVLPPDADTFYRRLRDNDYRVGVIGKVDMHQRDPWLGPMGDVPANYRYGFTHPIEIEAKRRAGRFRTPFGPYSRYLAGHGLLDRLYDDYERRAAENWVGPAGYADSVLPAEHWADTYIGGRATQWLQDIGEDFPWFLQVNFAGPHDPYDPPTETADLFRRTTVPAPIPLTDGKPAWVHKRAQLHSAADVTTARRQYAASVAAIDAQIGRIVAALRDTGQADRTMIIATADHGDLLGDHGMFFKTAPYEGSSRVPLIVSGPGIEAGARRDVLVDLMDVAATVCERTGTALPRDADARSFADQLGENAPDRHRTNVVMAAGEFAGVVTDRHKYIRSRDGFIELYDIVDDPGETVNLASAEPAIAAELDNLVAQQGAAE